MQNQDTFSESEELRSVGLNVTAQRLAVFRAVKKFPHAFADELCDQVRSEIGSISRQAVYDALNSMTEHGLLRRIQPAGSTARYEQKLDNHHHLVCRSCGKMTDTDCATGSAPCLSADDPQGYLIDEAEIIYWGMCPECQKNIKS
jgi:Fur family ferric uptake transcriptional regulator